MSTPINDGGPAFPTMIEVSDEFGNYKQFIRGMTLRDWFAGQALAGFSVMRVGDSNPIDWCWDDLCKTAYIAADAMLKAREEQLKA